MLHGARRRRRARCEHRQGDLEDLHRPTSRSRGRRTRTACSCTGRAAGGVWDAPTIDTVRGALYVGTGDAVTPPESPLTDAVVAIDLKTGKVLWSCRAIEDDLFMGGCNGPDRGEAVPEPDGAGLRHRQLADPGDAAERQARAVRRHQGRRRARARSRRQRRAAVSRQSLAGQPVGFTGRGRGGIVWGGAADGQQRLLRHGRGGPRRRCRTRRQDRLGVHRAWPPARQRRAWRGADDDSRRRVRGRRRRSALRGLGRDGKQLWEFNTAQPFETVNKVAGARWRDRHVSGAVIVDGMVYVGSGYAISAGASGGNVLLAFGVE